MNKTQVSIIIPAYNEAQTIGHLVTEIIDLYPDFEIIVVNDGSTDDTAAVAEAAGAIIFNHPYNIGNGGAVKSGIRVATGNVLVFMDGDGQHDPKDIAKLLDYFPDFDMVVGARPMGNQASWGHALAKRVYNWFASYVANFRIQDLTSGFRVVRSDIARNFLYLLPNTYSYPTTITLGVLRNGRSVKYIPLRTKNRQKGKSEIKILKDGVRFLMIIIKICALYSPLRIFLPISFLMFLLGLFHYVYTYITWGRFTNMGAILITTSILVFLLGLVSEQICQMRSEKSEGERFI